MVKKFGGAAAFIKQLFRDIKTEFGRFAAILLIIALGVSFFAGLTVAKSAMLLTGDRYVHESMMYDFRLLSTVGFDGNDAESIAENTGFGVFGSYSTDILCSVGESSNLVLKAHSLSDEINKTTLVLGRMPVSDWECVADSRLFGEDDIGKSVVVSEESGGGSDEGILKYGSYTIVGTVRSVYYMNMERGTGTLGNGQISGFIYLPTGGFVSDVFTELFVSCGDMGTIYSDEYISAANAASDLIEDETDRVVSARYVGIKSEAEDSYSEAKREYDEALAEYESEKERVEGELEDALSRIESGEAEISKNRAELEALAAAGADVSAQLAYLDASESELKASREEYEKRAAEVRDALAESEAELSEGANDLSRARAEIDDIPEPEFYVLGRDTNTGYACFENDSTIVEGIAKVFPVFFFLVAALVCSTTMTRMLDEQRTRIGTMKALGFFDGTVMAEYAAYAGIAAVIGAAAGFFLGTWLFPTAIWKAYDLLYGFSGIDYVFSPVIFALSMAAALVCSVGVTLAVGSGYAGGYPASLMRPKAPADGKRIFLERIGPLWKRFSFLHKVSARNIFRYKKRLIMMIFGIGGCMSLLITGFGLSDSIKDIVEYQYDDILKYDFEITFETPPDEAGRAEFLSDTADILDGAVFIDRKTADVGGSDGTKSAVIVGASEDISEYVDLHRDGVSVSFPAAGEVIMNEKLASLIGADIGDTVTISSGDGGSAELTLAGIFENYVYNYVYINGDTWRSVFGEELSSAMALSRRIGDTDAHAAAARLVSDGMASSVSVTDDIRERVDGMMNSMNYVIILVIICAGALAFIVLFNLGNINVTERVREIATIKVLGFYPGEVGAYVLRENLVLTLMGAAAGMIPGILLHSFVMSQIKIDLVSFNVRIAPMSFVFSVLLTLLFAAVTDAVLRRKLGKISMTESLKSVE